MYRYSSLYSVGLAVIILLSTSCSSTKPAFLKKEARFDTLNIQLDVRKVQQLDYRRALEQKMEKFVQVYNSEAHPFKLSFNKAEMPASCTVELLRIKFISPKQSASATLISAAGVGTAAYLIASKFFIPFGWVYIPNAKTTISPQLTNAISELQSFPKVTVISTGMYRKLDKQIDLQSTKVVKYVVTIVQNLELEYKNNLQQ